MLKADGYPNNNLQEFDIVDALELAALIDQEIQLISDDVSVGIDNFISYRRF
jgi:hypothetical protein